jgi:hypothetical protein
MAGKKRYSCNDRYFDRMSLEACYWAGFIAADGYINPVSSTLEITLSTRDAHHLQRFLNATNSDSKIETFGRRPNECRVRLNGVCRWINILEEKFNITTAKTSTLEPPNLMGNRLWAFVIGFLDGDGCITQNKGLLSVKFVGTSAMMCWLKQLFDDQFPAYNRGFARVADIHYSDVVKRYEVTGRRAQDILGFLKKINVPKMDRKWSKV